MYNMHAKTLYCCFIYFKMVYSTAACTVNFQLYYFAHPRKFTHENGIGIWLSGKKNTIYGKKMKYMFDYNILLYLRN